jgi:CHAT domain-containing protein
VVLSACRTVRSGTSRAGGFTGLSGALLAAGVGGAVGSTWEVDDRFTAALMTAFHGEYRLRRDGPRALRTAQLALLQSADPALRSPAAWAGFRYAGR